MKNKMLPLKESERNGAIDILRGIAILGIFLVNMPSFYSPYLYLNPQTYWEEGLDSGLVAFVDIFAQASFYPLFAFLFGYGAIVIAERSKMKGLSFPVLFTKRLVVLLLFGCIHAFLIWHGDILITYAVTGFLLMLFYKLKGKTMIITGLLLYIIPFSLLVFFAYLTLLIPDVDMSDLLYNQDAVVASLQIYSEGSFADITSQRIEDWLYVNGPGSAWLLIINILPLMLFGAGFAKQGWLTDVKKHKRLLMVLMLIGLIAGLLLKSLPYTLGANYPNQLVQDQFGGPLLALFYIVSVVLFVQNQKIYQILKPLANVGRMSMSNYLLQSVVFTIVFYGYGFGLYGGISYTTGFLIIIVFYSLQVLLSKWWIGNYQYGPVEFIWRWATYGQRPNMKRRRETDDEISNSGSGGRTNTSRRG